MFEFDLSKFSGAKHSGTIDKGEYLAVVDKMEWMASSAGEMMLVATISIILAHGGKKVVRDYFNLLNKTKQAAEISASRLADFVGACGLKEPPSDAQVFEGMRCRVKVGVDKNGFNTIERYIYWKPTNNNEVLRSNLVRLSKEVPSADTEVKTTNQDDLNDFVLEVPFFVNEAIDDSDGFGSEPF